MSKQICAIETLEQRALLSDVIASFASTQYGSHTFLFNSHSSKPGDAKKIERALWRFGDGTHQYGDIRFHTFTAAGTYRVRLTVTNGLGQSDDAVRTVVVGSTENTGSITGRVFNDRNHNGLRDSTKENWLAGEKVWIDPASNGNIDPGEYSTVTDSQGRYTFLGLKGDEFYGLLVRPAGSLLQNGAARQAVAVPKGMMVTPEDFAVKFGGNLTGRIAHDAIRNGVFDQGETYGGATRTVWIDTNGDGVLDPSERSASVDATGNYTFEGLPAGMHRIRVNLASDESQISPRPTRGLDVAVTQSKTTTAPAYMLILPNNSSVSGTVFNDTDGDNTHDAGEKLLPGRTAYLDIDQDTIFDAGEPSAVTDSAGRYTIPARANLPNPLLPIINSTSVDPRVVTSAGQRESRGPATFLGSFGGFRTIKPGEPLTGVALGLTKTAVLYGTLYFDSNRNGKNDDSSSLYGRGTVFADLNNNSLIDDNEPQATPVHFGEWKFPLGVKAGSYTIRVVTSGSYITSDPVGGVYTIDVTNGEEKLLNFGMHFGT